MGNSEAKDVHGNCFVMPEIEALCMHNINGAGKGVVFVTKYLYSDALWMSPVTTSVWVATKVVVERQDVLFSGVSAARM